MKVQPQHSFTAFPWSADATVKFEPRYILWSLAVVDLPWWLPAKKAGDLTEAT